MITASITYCPANIRMVDGCDSQAATDAVEAEVSKAAEEFAEGHDLFLKWRRLPEHEGCGTTFSINLYGEDMDGDAEASRYQEDLEYALSAACERAIENGDWEDAA